MRVTSELLKILNCPVSNDKLIYDQLNKRLVSPKALLAYPIVDGIPLVLEDKAEKITQNEVNLLLKSKE